MESIQRKENAPPLALVQIAYKTFGYFTVYKLYLLLFSIKQLLFRLDRCSKHGFELN